MVKKERKVCGMRIYRLEHCWRNKIIEIDKSGSRIYPLIFLKKKNRFGPDISLIMIRTKQIKIHIMRHRNTDGEREKRKKSELWFDFSIHVLLYCSGSDSGSKVEVNKNKN